MALGYSMTTWTVKTLANHLSRTYDCPITERTLRRRMADMGLCWKRPRYVYSTKDPHRAQKKGLSCGACRRVEPGAVILFEDETTLRWFPPLRGMWASRGEQAEVPITGQNAKRVLFGAINFRTGHRVILRRLEDAPGGLPGVPAVAPPALRRPAALPAAG